MTDDCSRQDETMGIGPGDMPEPGPDEPQRAYSCDDESAAKDAEGEEKGGFKQSARETVGKAVGIAVELGSILGGQGGEIVGAERAIAEAETEELIDRVDGEG